MSILNDLVSAAEEIKKLRGCEQDLSFSKRQVAELEVKLHNFKELIDLLLDFLIPGVSKALEEKAEIKKQDAYCTFNQKKKIDEFLNRPKLIGYTVLCTYRDEHADSAQNDSTYSLFVLVSDGRVLPVESLGLYGGIFEIKTSFLEAVVYQLPEIKSNKVEEKAPQCLDFVQKFDK